MGSCKIRTKLSKKNPYYISEYRRLELKYLCLQYPEWKRAYRELGRGNVSSVKLDYIRGGDVSDPTEMKAEMLLRLRNKMETVEKVAHETDKEIGNYIFKAVTENLSFTNLRSFEGIPCGKDMFYDRYHKFWYLLSRTRE